MTSKQGKVSTVPKFSSFKPKLDDPQPPKENKVVASSELNTHSTYQKRDRHASAVDASHHTNKAHSLKSSQRPHPQDQNRNTQFLFDTRGDPLIRRYGGNNPRQIPRYRRFGSGRILGIDGRMRVDQSGSRDEFFLLSHHESRSLLGNNRNSSLAKAARSKSRPIRIRREQSQIATGSEDYLPLRPSKKRKRASAGSGESSNEEETSYRSIHGKSKTHEHSDSELDYSSEASVDAGNRGIDDSVSLRSVELSRRVRDNPQDIDAWFELVNHQDIILRLTSQDGRHPTMAEVKSYADIKLSMLEKAYAHATSDSQRERLQLRIMQEGSKIWDTKTILKHWGEALKKHGTSFELWRDYASFHQSRLSAFQYEEVKQIYTEKLRQLETEALVKCAHPSRFQIYEQMIYVFLRVTRFISDAGYKELAVAAWQATFELTFARPPTLPERPENKIPSGFQDFWESEVSRIGEENAQGWAMFERHGEVMEPPEPRTLDAFKSPITRDGYKAWSIVEQYKAKASIYPARTMDDGAEDDPYRVVMFADIQDILLYFPTGVIPHIRGLLLDAFLVFCQLPSAFCSSGVIHDILQDEFLIHGPVKLAASNISSELSTNSEEQSTRPPDFLHDYQRMQITPDILFPLPNWFTCMKSIRDETPVEQYQWIIVTLKQLVRNFGIRELSPYYLAFASVNEPGNEKKTAKALLKQDPTNINLYKGYATLEWTKGDKDVARNTVAAALGLPAISSHQRLSLGIFGAWMELEDCKTTGSILQLCVSSDDSLPRTSKPDDSAVASAAQILKTRQFLSSNRDCLLSSSDHENAIIYAEGLALLEYLTQRSNKEPSSGAQGDIWSAISSFSACSDELVSRGLGSSSSHERLLQSAARLLYHHASRG